MTTLSPAERRALKQKAHALKPVVLLGSKGLTPAVHNEIDQALNAHELIKVRLNVADKALREAMISEICETQQAALVQHIGHLIAIYRKKLEK